MKILWHMPTMKRTACGLSRRALRFAEGLRTFGHDVSFVVAADRTDFDAADGASGFELDLICGERRRPLHWSLQARAKAADARDFVRQLSIDCDLFISCQPEMVSAYKSKHAEKPVVYVCGGSTILHDAADAGRIDGVTGRLGGRIDRFLKHRNEKTGFKSADVCVFDSQSTRDRVVKAYGVSPAKCKPIFAAVDGEYFRPPSEPERIIARESLGIMKNDFVVAWTGRLSPEKNLETLLSALPKLPSDVRLKLVGNGPSRPKLESQIAAQDLQSRVEITEAIEDVRPFLWATDAFVFPSVSESLGLSLIEAMSCGLPCIGLRPNESVIRNASVEILGESEFGILVDRNESIAFAQAIDLLRKDSALRAKLARAARRRAVDRYEWKIGSKQLNSLVTSLVCRSNGIGPNATRLYGEIRANVSSQIGG